jgi:hypothetical protein
MVDWGFLFEAMAAIGIPEEFVNMVRILFQDAAACVKINGSFSESFAIERGVWHGCPLAPYLFLITVEVLNRMVAAEASTGRVQGIKQPVEERQQIVAQYADDTSFTLLGEEEHVRNLIYFLETFYLASGLVLNWQKSYGYWKSSRDPFRPPWTNMLGVTWADAEDVSKLLGAPSGLSLILGDVDTFLYERIQKKLSHWTSVKSNPTGRVVIVNIVLLGACFFFLSIWGGTKKGIARVKSLMIN